MDKINWINGQAGGTPLSAENLNLMQENIENAINAVQTIMEGTILYDNSTGTTGDVTLSQSITNIKRIRINGYIIYGDINYNFSQDFDVTFNGKVGLLFKGHVGGSYNYIVGEPIELSSTTITRGAQKQFGFGTNVNVVDVPIYITKVVGFNY